MHRFKVYKRLSYVHASGLQQLTLDSDFVINIHTTAQFLKINPNNQNRIVTLPSAHCSFGVFYVILNTSSNSYHLDIKDDLGNAVITLDKDTQSTFICDGSLWHSCGKISHVI